MYIMKGRWIESKLQVFMEVDFNKIFKIIALTPTIDQLCKF